MNNKHKIIIAVTGASGAIYAKVLFDKLQKLNDQIDAIGVGAFFIYFFGWTNNIWINY